MAVRYEARGLGTREEIIAELAHRRGAAGGSARRKHDADEAIAQLEAGASSVRVGHIVYVVTGQPG